MSGRVAGLAVQGLVFWLLLAVLGQGQVALQTWMALHAVLALAMWALRTARWSTARWAVSRWLAVALYAALLGAMFAGAEAGLDALHGAHRPRAAPWALLGGLELWQVLCPGIVSLAAGAACDACWTRHRPPGPRL